MAILWIVVFSIIALIVLYAVFGREWLKKKTWPWSVRFFHIVEPIEIALWKKSETILLARLKVLVGVLLSVLTSLSAFDITPLMPLVPERWQGAMTVAFNLLPLTISFIGMIDEKMRYGTTMPVAMVAVPDNPPVEVAVAVEQAASAKTAALVTIAAEKQEPIVIPEKKE